MPRDAPVSKVAAVGAARRARRISRATRWRRRSSSPRPRRRDGRRARAPVRRPRRDRRSGHARRWSCSRRSPTWPAWSCPSAAAAWPAGSASRCAGARTECELVGVQARACAPYASALGGRALGRAGARRRARRSPTGSRSSGPGALTLPLLRELLDGMETVTEDEIADAMVFLAERAKLVAEGAGAVSRGRAAERRACARSAGPPWRSSPAATSTAGCSPRCCAAAKPRRAGACASSRACPTGPAGWPSCSQLVARARANVVSVEHVREAVPLHVRETGVELTLETRGRGHTERGAAPRSRAGGYEVTLRVARRYSAGRRGLQRTRRHDSRARRAPLARRGAAASSTCARAAAARPPPRRSRTGPRRHPRASPRRAPSRRPAPAVQRQARARRPAAAAASGRCSARRRRAARRPATGLRHRLDDVGHALGDRLERRTRDVRRPHARVQSRDHAVRRRPPPRRAEARERRKQHHARAVGDRRRPPPPAPAASGARPRPRASQSSSEPAANTPPSSA